jgi:hypothetical protein
VWLAQEEKPHQQHRRAAREPACAGYHSRAAGGAATAPVQRQHAGASRGRGRSTSWIYSIILGVRLHFVYVICCQDDKRRSVPHSDLPYRSMVVLGLVQHP